MKGKKNQSTFMKIVTSPLKALGKARDFYIKSITGCATSYGHSMSVPDGHLPKSYSVGSTMSSDGGYGDDYGELIRAASVRSLGHKNEIEMLMHQMKQQQQQKQLPKSCSVGMGFMGRIDEENGGEDEGSVDGSKKGSKADMYSRSRSYAVAERRVAF